MSPNRYFNLIKKLPIVNFTALCLGLAVSISAQNTSPNVSPRSEPIWDSREGDSLALVALYDSLDGVNWNNDSNWLSVKPIEEWHGVTVDSGRIAKIELGENQLSGGIPYLIKNLKMLNLLDLSENKISYIPAEIGLLSNLIKLRLSENDIDSIPKEIGGLSKLKYLYFDQNNIQNIPIKIGNLINLIQLGLSSNKIEELPKEIGDLSSLISLGLSFNSIKYLPPEIGNLKALISFFLMYNKLLVIPTEIQNLTRLSTLAFSNNQISIIPKKIANMPRLSSLNLGYNNITIIPKEIAGLSSLRYLSLGHNQISNIPVEIGTMTNLKDLHLYNNQITDIPSEIENMTSLEDLELHNNQITQIPIEIGNIPNLKSLQLWKNKITDIPHEITKLTQVTYHNYSENLLDFASIESSFGRLLTRFYYSPQDTLGIVQNFSWTSKIGVTVGGSKNHYKWFKDGISLNPNSDSDSLNITQTGSYHVEITSDSIPDLTLVHHPIIVESIVAQSSSEILSSFSIVLNSSVEPFSSATLSSSNLPSSSSHALSSSNIITPLTPTNAQPLVSYSAQTLTLQGHGEIQIKILDLSGQRAQKLNSSLSGNTQVQLERPLETGVYFLRLSNSSDIFKLVIQ
jgi:Leucine-rich repeat (LRR) protein